MRKFSISDKLILASLLISIITIIIVASYSFYNARVAILDRTFNQLTSVRSVKSKLLENYFSNRIHEAQLITSISDVSNIITQVNDMAQSEEYKIINELEDVNIMTFSDYIGYNYFSRILVVGSNNYIYDPIVSTKDHWPYKVFDTLWDVSSRHNKPVVHDIQISENPLKSIIAISTIIHDSVNNKLAMIIFELPFSAIDSIMLEIDPSTGFGKSGESYLVAGDCLMRSTSRFQPNSIFNTRVETEAVKKAMDGVSGTLVIDDYRGVSVLSSFGSINTPNLNWVILAEIDFAEATVPIYRIRNEIVFISIFIFLIVLVVVFVLSRRITFPLQRLNNAAVELGKGNFNVSIEHNNNDEIGDLTNTFNLMVNRLKEQSVELELERNKSLTSLIDGQESERQRLSRELHDSLGQLLIALKLKYESCIIAAQNTNSNFEDLGLLFDKTIDETRRISNNLMPAALSEFGLTSTLRNICNEIADSAGIRIDFVLKGAKQNLSSKQKIYVFRMAQESLTNIIKHSQAKNATMEVVFKTDKLCLNINDDGIGFNSDEINHAQSNGLNNIKDRVSLLSGSFKLQTKKGEGTSISIIIPL